MLERKMLLRIFAGLAIATLGAACGDDAPGETTGAETGGETGDATATGDGDTGEGTGGLSCQDEGSNEDFLAVFGYRYRIPGPAPEGKSAFDLQMMKPVQKYEPINLTSFLPKQDDITCQYGCLLDQSLRFIAINGAPPDENGFDFQIGLINNCLDVQLKGLVFEDKAHFAFAGHYIYYSQRTSCNGPSCQYQIWRVNLDNPSEQDLLVPFFPPADDPDWVNGDSTYKGRFHVSPDGDSLVMLSPTIRSQRVYLWTKGTLHEVDYLCDNFQNNQCIGAGSNYTDNDPVAISPDSKFVVMFTVTDRALRLRRYSTENPNDMGSLTLLGVPADAGGAYHELACVYREPWQFTSVVGIPTYNADGSRLFFIARSDCTPGADKPETDILWLNPERINKLQPIEEADVYNVTKNAKGSSAVDNHEITGLALSPDGQRLVYTATPHLTSNWKPMQQTDGRHLSDHEIYKISVCGDAAGGEQLTSDVSFEASTPVILPTPDIASCPGHPLEK